MIGVIVALGAPKSSAVVAVLAYRAISFWLATLPGIGGYLALRSTVRRWRAAGAGSVSSRLRRARPPDPA